MRSDLFAAQPVQHEGSIANLAASLASAMGASRATSSVELSAHSELKNQLTDRQLIVFFLLDGVGANQIATHVPSGSMAADQLAVLSSVFPSSTAPAITSLMSGQCVADHAITGWHLQRGVDEGSFRPLPMDEREHPGQAAPASIHQWVPWAGQTSARCVAIKPKSIVNSTYSTYCLPRADRFGYKTFDQIPAIFDEAIDKTGSEQQFCYIYIPDFDSTSHHFGWLSPEANQCINALDVVYEQLASRVVALGGTIVTVSDHGFTDTDPDKQVWLNDFPSLYELLEAPLSGEPRATICHVKENDGDKFIERASNELASICSVHRTQDLIDANWFGAIPSAANRYRFGTHWLIPHDGVAVFDQLDGEKRPQLIGMHGGITDSEMQVPLIVRS
jgi:hypothetical protein